MCRITPDLHTLAVSQVNCLMNFNQPWSVKFNLSGFSLREVIDGRVIPGDVDSKI